MSLPLHGLRRAALALPAIAVAAGLTALPGAANAATPVTKLKPLTTATASGLDACPGKAKSLSVGGTCKWSSTLRFKISDAALDRGRLKLKLSSTTSGSIRVKAGSGAVKPGLILDSAKAKKGTLSFDVLDALPEDGGTVALVVESTSSATGRFTSPRLEVRVDATPAPSNEPAGGDDDDEAPAPTTPTAPVNPAPVPPTSGNPSAPTNIAGVWLDKSEILAAPMSGAAWTRVKAAADGSLGTPDIANQDSNHDVNTLAAALVYVRTGNAAYRTKAASAILGAIGTEDGGRTLALGRNLVSYVIAADLIDLRSYDAAGEGRFRTWLTGVRRESLEGKTLISTHEERPNNWGTMAGASRIAADLYLGDGADLSRAASVLRGYLGDRSAYAGFDFGDLSYQANPSAPVGINPAGATKNGVDIDGAIPDDMRRGCGFQVIPCHTNYAWEAMQGVVVQAELLAKHGQPAFSWSDNAVLRAAQYLHRLDQRYGGWWAASDDQWQPWLINHAYRSNLPVGYGGPGKLLGWTDWVYGG